MVDREELKPFQTEDDGMWWVRVSMVVLGPYETRLEAIKGYQHYLNPYDLNKASGVWA